MVHTSFISRISNVGKSIENNFYVSRIAFLTFRLFMQPYFFFKNLKKNISYTKSIRTLQIKVVMLLFVRKQAKLKEIQKSITYNNTIQG